MKLFAFAEKTTTRNRLISLALAVATLLTALVALPITLPVTAEGEMTEEEFANYVYNNWGKPGPHSITWEDMAGDEPNPFLYPRSVYYATDFGSSNMNDLFRRFTSENQTNDVTFHQNMKAWQLTVSENVAGDPFIKFSLFAPRDVKEYSYITVTYTVDVPAAYADNLYMRLFLSTAHQGYHEKYSYSAQVTAPSKEVADYRRVFHTVIFDVSSFPHTGNSEDRVNPDDNQSQKKNDYYDIRLDFFNEHFVGGQSVTDYIVKGMTMYVDSIGVFKSYEEANYHAQERDVARNYYSKNVQDESYSGRNIYRASSQSWRQDFTGGYITMRNVGNLHNNTDVAYDPIERAYKLTVNGNGEDPKVSFIINGQKVIYNNPDSSGNDDDVYNQVDRSLTRGGENGYNFVSVVYKVEITKNDGSPNGSSMVELFKGPNMRLFLLADDGNGQLDTWAGNEVDAVTEYNGKLEEKRASYNQLVHFEHDDIYHTAVFNIGNITGTGDLSKIVGIRLDPFNYEAGEGETEAHVVGASIFIDSIGFFKTEAEAKALTRTPVHWEGSEVSHFEDAHNIIPTTDENGLKLTVANTSCTCASTSSCVHLKQQTDAESKSIAIDPRVNIRFSSGSLPVNDYRYIVLTYTVPDFDINNLETVNKKYTCPVHPNEPCANNKENLYLFEEGTGKENNPPFSLLSVFLLFNDEADGSGQVMASEDYRRDAVLYQKDNGKTVQVVLEITDKMIETMKANNQYFVGLRFDPFNYHYATIGSHVVIKSVDIVTTLDEAYKNQNVYKDQYKIEYQVRTELPNTASYPKVYQAVASVSQGVTVSSETLTNGQYADDWLIPEHLTFVRAHYEFEGFKVYYEKGNPDDSTTTLVELWKDEAKTSNTYKPKDTIHAVLDNNCYTTKETTIADRSHMTLRVVLMPIWTPSKRLLTIKPPTGADAGECIYKITGTTVYKLDTNTGTGTGTSTPQFETLEMVVAAGANGSSAGDVSVWLPDGTYTVQILTDWGWRYLGSVSEDGTVMTSQDGIAVLQWLDNFENNGDFEHIGDGIRFNKKTEGYDKVANPASAPVANFTDLNPKNDLWLNGYGYAASTAAESTTEQTNTPAA